MGPLLSLPAMELAAPRLGRGRAALRCVACLKSSPLRPRRACKYTYVCDVHAARLYSHGEFRRKKNDSALLVQSHRLKYTRQSSGTRSTQETIRNTAIAATVTSANPPPRRSVRAKQISRESLGQVRIVPWNPHFFIYLGSIFPLDLLLPRLFLSRNATATGVGAVKIVFLSRRPFYFAT